MTSAGWVELVSSVILTFAAGWPLGGHIARVWMGERTWLDPVIGPVERGFDRLLGVEPDASQDAWAYTRSLLTFSAAGFLVLYALLRAQGAVSIGGVHRPGFPPDLAFTTAIAFVTNTDWRAYSGDLALSPLTLMAGFTTQNFASAGSGMAIAAAVTRAFAANRGRALGNFWRDLTRNVLYVLLPLSVVVSLILIALGVPQTIGPGVVAKTLEGATQIIPLGPVASLEAISLLGTNGAAVFGAGSAHPFQNPNSIANLVQIVAMGATSVGCLVAFGRVTRRRSDARALVAVAGLFVLVSAALVYVAETRPTPASTALTLSGPTNLEGKEVRFGAPGSAAFAVMTTSSAFGGSNARHESLSPAGGGIALFLMEIGEMVPGAVGAGLYSLLVVAMLAVFVAGLMVGRTPEYLGKKIETREIKLAMLAILVLSASTLGPAALAAITPAALSSVSATGAHGMTELLYTFASGAANNGSAFEGLRADTPFFNVAMGLAMALGRFGYAAPVLALAGGLVAKPRLPFNDGTFPTDGPLFVGLICSVILIMAGLQYFPSLALGPIREQIEMNAAVARLAAR
jgi:K+-transporting ATPase ATPase A chain